MRSASSAAWPPAPSVPVCGMLMPIFTGADCARAMCGRLVAAARGAGLQYLASGTFV